jgi:hypothetical protein
MLLDLSLINKIESDNFLLGLDEYIDGYITSVGYKIVSNNLNKFIK